MKDKLIEHIARKICYSSIYYDPRLEGAPVICPHCENDPTRCIWPSFVPEANAAFEAVRDFAILSYRKKPKI